MQALWSSDSYELRLLSLPMAMALAALVVVIAYAVVMRGAAALRAWFLGHSLALLPYTLALTLAPSIRAPGAALLFFRLGGALIPISAAAGTGFQLALSGELRAWRWRLVAMMTVTTALAVWGLASDAVIGDVRWLPAGLWFPTVGPWAPLAALTTFAVAAPGFSRLAAAARRAGSAAERRQLRQTLIANTVTSVGLVDVALAYGHGVFPVGWLLIGVGGLLTLRALVVEDLLRVRAIDTLAPQLVAHAAVGILVGWASLSLLGATTWWGAALVILAAFAGVRVMLAVIGLVNRGARGGEGPLDRLAAQLVERARALTSEAEVARLAIDVVELGLGLRPAVLLAAAEEWRWTTADGTHLADDLAPDPLVVGWLLEQRSAVFADELELRAPEDLRDALRGLFRHQDAHAVVPLASHDEVLGLFVIPRVARRVRGPALAFLGVIGERLAEALLHARMAARAAARAAIGREVELAATVQARLLPDRGPHLFGAVQVMGSWRPATQCGGDFWGVYPLDDDQVLVAIGDVTGHGVASAMITAAAAGACDVAVRQRRGALDLVRLVAGLDAAVARIGGGELAMTCCVAIIDPRRAELRFVSCGHPAGYLCRAGTRAELELHALVGRGNPVGSGLPTAPKVITRALLSGDLMCWYTDGLTETQDPSGEPFGDRRLQRLLRRLERARLAAPTVHDAVYASISSHRAGRPRQDDQTLVVAQIITPVLPPDGAAA